jgi:hypothetical protein
MPKRRPRRVRIALRQPSEWRLFRRQTEARLNQLDFSVLVERVMRHAVVIGSAAITEEDIQKVMAITAKPHRKWVKLIKTG